MGSTAEEGDHVHEPCARCGVVEAETDGLCAECVALREPAKARGKGRGKGRKTP